MYESELLILIHDLGIFTILTVMLIAVLIGYHQRHKMISKLDNYFDYLQNLRQLDNDREYTKYNYKNEKLKLKLDYKLKIKEFKQIKIKM